MEIEEDDRDAGVQPPFSQQYELYRLHHDQKFMPGNRRILVHDTDATRRYSCSELVAKDLDTMAPHLWMTSTQSGANISPLHRQRVKGREIIITEEPRLHLVWLYDPILIKPLPKYLVSYDFLQRYLLSDASPLGSKRDEVCRAAFGFLRTYHHLIVHESDSDIACEKKLLPAGLGWDRYCDFSARFSEITDAQVSPRYTYGEMRLTRLNLFTKLFLRKWQYERISGQYGAYFSRFYGPVLFVFALWSVILSAMQVELAVEVSSLGRWEPYRYFCRWFGGMTVGISALIGNFLALLLAGMVVDDWMFALRRHFRKRREKKSKLDQNYKV